MTSRCSIYNCMSATSTTHSNALATIFGRGKASIIKQKASSWKSIKFISLCLGVSFSNISSNQSTDDHISETVTMTITTPQGL